VTACSQIGEAEKWDMIGDRTTVEVFDKAGYKGGDWR
jgi:hypothetical protein